MAMRDGGQHRILLSIVTYNGGRYLRHLLPNLARVIAGDGTQDMVTVLLVDNASTEPLLLERLKLPPRMKRIRVKTNHRYLGGLNVTVDYFKRHPEYTHLLMANDDIMMWDGFFKALPYVCNNDKADMWGFREVRMESPEQFICRSVSGDVSLTPAQEVPGAIMGFNRCIYGCEDAFDYTFRIYGAEHELWPRLRRRGYRLCQAGLEFSHVGMGSVDLTPDQCAEILKDLLPNTLAVEFRNPPSLRMLRKAAWVLCSLAGRYGLMKRRYFGREEVLRCCPFQKHLLYVLQAFIHCWTIPLRKRNYILPEYKEVDIYNEVSVD